MPLGHDEEGACLVLDDFIEDAVEEGPGWVDVGADLIPAVGKRVASKGVDEGKSRPPPGVRC